MKHYQSVTLTLPVSDTTKLKEWNAKRKFKGAGKAVMAMQAFAKPTVPKPKNNNV